MRTWLRLIAAPLLLGAITPVSSAHGPGHGQRPEQPKQQAETPAQTPSPDAEVLMRLANYRAAMEARSIEKLEAVVDPGLLVLEGVHKNVGWNDYRDKHIGPEMKEWQEFKVIDPKILEVSVEGDWAYVVQESTVRITMQEKVVTLASAETFVLKRGPSGWRIRHIHLSSQRKGSPSQPAKVE